MPHLDKERQRTVIGVRNAQIKAEGRAALGNKCVCCGESFWGFLTLDHINKRRTDEINSKTGKGYTGMAAWRAAKRNDWSSDDYQLLCFNCNCAKGVFGKCPHLMTEAELAEIEPVLEASALPERTHCSKGHALVDGNIYLCRGGRNNTISIRCRACALYAASVRHRRPDPTVRDF